MYEISNDTNYDKYHGIVVINVINLSIFINQI